MNWASWAGRTPQMQCALSPHASLPTDVCTVVSDPTCQVSRSMVCDPVVVTDECLLTVRRAFEEPGTYCINITLGDDTSQALASALISVNGGESTKSRCELLVKSFSLWSFPCRGKEHSNAYGSSYYAWKPQLRLHQLV